METIDQQLAAVAKLAADSGIDLDDFMKAAWNAYVETRPGMRAKLEHLRMVQELEVLRAAGRVGQA
jgi:hypothetical protein